MCTCKWEINDKKASHVLDGGDLLENWGVYSRIIYATEKINNEIIEQLNNEISINNGGGIT